MNFYSIDTLWRQSDNWDIQWNEEHQYFTIDNYYENPDDIFEHLSQRQVPC